MEKELAILKAENRQLLSKLENEKLAKPHQDSSHHNDRNVTENQVATLEAKILEYSCTISKFILTNADHMITHILRQYGTREVTIDDEM